MIKHFFFLLVFSSTAAAVMTLPSMDDYYQKTKITIPARERAQFVFGDNLAGYYENFTHSYRQGQGYLFKNRNLFGDFTAVRDGVLLNKTAQATHSEILIHGVRTFYKDGTTEELSLFSRQLGLGIEISHTNAGHLGALLLFNERTNVSVTLEKNVVLIQRDEKDNDIPGYVAITASVPFSWERFGTNAPWLRQRPSVLSIKITSAQSVQTIHVYVAFGFTANEAKNKAAQWAARNFYVSNKHEVYVRHTKSMLWTDNDIFNQALAWSIAGSYVFVVEEFGKGIWAGLPWFRDNWGRDTFIALPGTLLVTGQFNDARGVITNFATFQNRGIPHVEIVNIGNKGRAIRDRVTNLFQRGAVLRSDRVSLSLDNRWLDAPAEVNRNLAILRQEFPEAQITYEVLTNREFGRVPNRVAAGGSIIYNTTDGTPWLIREIYEYLAYTKDEAFVRQVYPTVVTALNGAIQHHVDAQGFLTHGDQDTWMDASRGPGREWSPRGNRAVEIQALWANALQVGIRLATIQRDDTNAQKWRAIYNNLKTNFPLVFWNEYHKNIADRVLADGRQDMRIRPNSLMLLSVPLFDTILPIEKEAHMVRKIISELLFPYGIASLSPRDVFFHPYHDNNPNYHKDAAYHNGTVWGWNAGFTITALLRHGYTELAYALTTNLSHQILFMGTRGNMSELVDAIPRPGGDIKLSGTYAQAWSISEFARNAFQDYLGVRPNLLQNIITFEPNIPAQWNRFTSRVALGRGNLFAQFERRPDAHVYTLSIERLDNVTISFIHNRRGQRTLYHIPLQPNTPVTIEVSDTSVTANKQVLTPVAELQPSMQHVIGELRFAEPKIYPHIRAHRQRDFLRTIIDRKEYHRHLPRTRGGLFGW